MDKKTKEEYKIKADKSPLWVLELRLSKQNIILTQLKGQGVSSSDTQWRKIVDKRNFYRNCLIERLQKWKKGELKEESNPNYNDYVRTISYNKFGENNE